MSSKEELKKAFDYFDKDGSGEISNSELGAAMEMLGYTLTKEQVQTVVTSLDKDSSGDINFDEFLTFVEKAKAGL